MLHVWRHSIDEEQMYCDAWIDSSVDADDRKSENAKTDDSNLTIVEP